MANYELTDEDVARIREALKHRAAYMKATNRDEAPYLAIAEKLELPRKAAGKESRPATVKRKLAG